MRGAADHAVDFGEMRAMRLDTHQQQLHKNQHDDYRRADHQVVGVEIVECGGQFLARHEIHHEGDAREQHGHHLGQHHVPADGVHLGMPLPRAEPASHNADAAHREHPHDGEHPQQQRKQIIHTPASGYAASRAARWAAIFLRMRMAVSSSIGRPATRPDPAEPTFAEDDCRST